jgi:glycosyltransferase involved in cell wall biosynthesis
MAKLHLLVLPSFYPDKYKISLGSFFKEQVGALAESGIQVNVLYVEQKSLRDITVRKLMKNRFQRIIEKEAIWKEYRVKGWHIPALLGRKIWIYMSERLIDYYIKENGKPDLIHAHNAFFAGVVAKNIKSKYRIPFVITEHDSAFLSNNLSGANKKLALGVYQKAEKVISVSRSLRNSIKDLDSALDISIVPNLVDTDFFTPIVGLTRENKNTRFLAIGNLNKNKGHEMLIEAFKKVFEKNQNIELFIAGEGPQKNALKEMISELKLTNKVALLGQLNKEQIVKVIQSSDCLVHNSSFETFGVVLIEALACGIPIIATKCGGPEDIYREGLGYLINVENKNELYNAMIDFLGNRNKFVANLLRNHVVENYSKKSIAQKLKTIYQISIQPPS